MQKTYDPKEIEKHWYEQWEKKGYFSFGDSGTAYCIMLPPPNVTGNLHMGHAFQHTLMDILIRYHRMLGNKTLWQCGTDHAGIATQMVVERQLSQQGLSRHALGRDKFIEAVWEWKEQSGNTITRQCRRLGTSMDWQRERFTLDEGLSHAVQQVFIQLYEEDLIYRGKRLVNWDPVLHTAISDLEVISEEENGHMWHMRYPRVDGKGYVVVATTRPETMLGDVAVAVHPDDTRYRDLVGKEVELPLTGRSIPVITDEYVDPEFGTGCVKITPAHDFNDYAVGQRHNLPLINIFTIDAQINELGPEKYRGLDRYTARKQIVKDLEARKLLEKVEDHKLMVPRGDRSGAVIEPYLTDQWYVKIQPLAGPAIKAVEDGMIKFVPDNWSKTYFEWMHNIEDWCISRQLWWGHRIPAWYDPDGNIFVGESETAVREKYQLDDDIQLEQDQDVLDTWFSSALWPFSTLGWPEQTEELKTFYPTSVLVTGFDIIFFWVARMIMFGIKFMEDVPFKEVYITGLIRDEHGQKMSKSKGNIIDPIDLIDGIELDALVEKRISGLMQPQLAEKIEQATRKSFPEGIQPYGTDALRFTFASLASNTRDINFDTGRIGGYRNFCNKIWNATRYVMMTIASNQSVFNPENRESGLAEKWNTSLLAELIENVTRAIDTYRFDIAAKKIYEFTWDEFCDWYVELSKATLADPEISDSLKSGTLYCLVNNLEILLRIIHPVMPYITEALWQKVAPIIDRRDETIMLQKFPDGKDLQKDPEAVSQINWIKSFILAVRRIRAERNIPPGQKLDVRLIGGSPDELRWLGQNRYNITFIGRIGTITETDTVPDDAVIELAGNMTIAVPLSDLIDTRVEINRLEKELSRLSGEKTLIENKLNNDQFINKAPTKVVEKERSKLQDIMNTEKKLTDEYQRIKSLNN